MIRQKNAPGRDGGGAGRVKKYATAVFISGNAFVVGTISCTIDYVYFLGALPNLENMFRATQCQH